MVPRDHDIYASPLSLLGNKEREEERDGKKERAYKAGEGEGGVKGVRGREVGDLTRAEKTFFSKQASTLETAKTSIKQNPNSQ